MNDSQLIWESYTGKEISIDRLRTPRGTIGNQGATADKVASILNHLGLNVKGIENNMRKLIDSLKGDPSLQAALRKFTQQNPIKISIMSEPDGSEYIHIEDGHHRAFLLDQIGDKTVPVSR